MAELRGDGNMSETDEIVTDSEDINFENGNMVFQCVKCNAILGDTMSWVEGNNDLGTFSIKHVSDDVELGNTILASDKGFDMGSTYKDVHCAACKANVGCYYLATTKAVDHLRMLYTLFSSDIKVYELNSGGAADRDHSLNLDVSDLPFLNLRNLTLHVRKGMIMQLSTHVTKISKAINVPMPAYDLSTESDDAPEHDPVSRIGAGDNASHAIGENTAKKTLRGGKVQFRRKKRERSQSMEKETVLNNSGHRCKKNKSGY